ncbi:MAG: 50S ribosomal protein L18e [Candidatus Micrarchaeota archaeon]|nr:50S ribosomal protein L18e [Candidatus Micrarchaeota archaeon]
MKGPENKKTLELAVLLGKLSRENKAPIWKAISVKLLSPRRRRTGVNLSKIDRFTSDGDAVIVPGKVLGTGELTHRVAVAAFGFSSSAKAKLGANAIGVMELAKKFPKGTGVKIIS